MSSFNIILTSDLHQFVTQRAKDTHHATATAYLRTLVKQEKKRVEQKKLSKMLLNGLDSGPPIPVKDLTKHFAKKKTKIAKQSEAQPKSASQ